MRPIRIIASCFVLALAIGCAGKTIIPTPPGDSASGGDPNTTAVTPPLHVKITSSSGKASSPNFKARVRVGGPVPLGGATGSGKKLQGSNEQSP